MTFPKPAHDLVEDAKRLVLQYVSLPSDLSALCLVSKAWNYVGTERLYANILIDVRPQVGHISLFVRCIANGAGRQLRYTRRLSFVDIGNLDEMEAKGLFTTAPGEIQEDIMRILKLVPDGRLRSFRYLSKAPLAEVCVAYLTQHQHLIQELHITSCDPLQLIRPSVKSLTAGFDGDAQKTHVFLNLISLLGSLDSLSIIFWEGWSEPIFRYWERWLHDHPGIQKLDMKRLSVSGYFPKTLVTSFRHMLDLSQLTHLILNDCRLEIFTNLIAPSNHVNNLTSLEISTKDLLQREEGIEFQRLIEENTRLQDVRFSIHGLRGLRTHNSTLSNANRREFTFSLWPIRQQLRTLAWYDPGCGQLHDFDEDFYDTDYDANNILSSRASVESVSRDYPALRELGLCVPEQPLLEAHEGVPRYAYLLTYLEPIFHWGRNIHLVHLYQSRIRSVEFEYVRTEEQIASEVHEFANIFFQEAHDTAPQLQILMWGIHRDAQELHQTFIRLQEIYSSLQETTDDQQALEQNQKYCFIKQVTCDSDGKKHIYASRITQSRLRDQFPGLELLTYDPNFGVLDRCMSRTDSLLHV